MRITIATQSITFNVSRAECDQVKNNLSRVADGACLSLRFQQANRIFGGVRLVVTVIGDPTRVAIYVSTLRDILDEA